MKKTLLTAAVGLAVFSGLGFNEAMAQTAPTNPSVSGTTGNPATLDVVGASEEVLKVLFFRTHTVSIDTHAAQMRADGVSERAFVAGFTMEGALAYDHEMAGDGLTPELEAGRNAGLQLVPYKVSLATDGRVYISTSAVAFKNMNSEMADNDLRLGKNCYSDCEDAWKVIDQLSAVNMEYNKDVAMGIEEKRISIASIDMKLGIFESSDGNFFIALKGGATPIGWHETKILDVNGVDRTLKGLETELRYGMQFLKRTDKGWRFDGGVDFKNRWSYDEHHVSDQKMAQWRADKDQYAISMSNYNQAQAQYDSDLNTYQQDKEAYEQQNGYNEPISDESYAVITGNTKPEMTTGKPGEVGDPSKGRTLRSLMLATPSLNVSKSFARDGKSPVRVGVGISANLPIGDYISGEFNGNITGRGNGSLITGRLFINF